jgi:tetratricopeptide (TPR) repeat protein
MGELPGNRAISALLCFAVLLAWLTVTSPAEASVWLSSITGTCIDEQGKPLADAVLRFTDPANGRHFEVTSDADGRFNYIAVEPSRYRLDIYRTRHQQVTFAGLYLEWSFRPLLLEINLQKDSVTISRQVMLAESFGSEQPAAAAAESGDAAKARAINQQLAAAKAFMDAGDWDRALTAAKAATEIDPGRDLPWAWLANIFCEEALHAKPPTDAALQNCVQNYGYAIAIAPNATYYNNLGTAYSGLKNWREAAENFRAAAQLNPGRATLYRQNLGAALLNQAEALSPKDGLETIQLALVEFTSAATSAPPLPEAFYWQGLCQLRLAAAEIPGSSFKSADKSFRRYLQLSPTGQYASQARAMLEGLQEFSAGAQHGDSNP